MLQNHRTDLIVALDYSRADRAFHLIETLLGLPVIFKVGLELFMNGGPDLVKELVHRKNRIFLDLKYHDIPNTVAKAIKQASLLHVEMLTVHLAGGSSMMRAIADELSDIPQIRPKILGVSVLTSFDDVRWAEVTKSITGHAMKATDSAVGLVEAATSWNAGGLDGIVCSALELEQLSRGFSSLYKVVPGIRPTGFLTHDQARVTTPSEARQRGANAVVVGRPITLSAEPRQVTEGILTELSQPLPANHLKKSE